MCMFGLILLCEIWRIANYSQCPYLCSLSSSLSVWCFFFYVDILKTSFSREHFQPLPSPLKMTIYAFMHSINHLFVCFAYVTNSKLWNAESLKLKTFWGNTFLESHISLSLLKGSFVKRCTYFSSQAMFCVWHSLILRCC